MADFFDSDTIAFEICSFLRIIPGFKYMNYVNKSNVVIAVLSSCDLFLFIGLESGLIKKWNMETGILENIFQGHSHEISSISTLNALRTMNFSHFYGKSFTHMSMVFKISSP